MRSVLYVICAIGVLACAGTVPGGAHAAFPGANGKIAFASTRDGNNEIYTMNSDGSAQADISNNAASDLAPAWSPGGTEIAFASNRDGNFEIYKMNADGAAQTRLTNNAATDSVPAWTSDGRIVFDRGGGTGGCLPGAEIYIMNADGSGETNITNNAAGDCVPSGSMSGSIVFTSDRDTAGGEVYTMNPDGSGVTRITNNELFDGYPNWSPDAARIVFIGPVDNDVWVMQADGSGRTQLTDTPNRFEFFPAWSPQGDKIVFDGLDASRQIYVMNADGSGEVALTTLGGQKPDWQPSGPPPPPPPIEKCVVSRVLGLRLGAAKRKIRAAHCSVGRVSHVRSRRSLRGRVVNQAPRAGSIRRLNFPVALALGRG